MLPEQRDVFDEIIVKMRSGRMSRRLFLERAVAIGLSASAAASLLDACGSSGSGGTGSTTTIVWTSENEPSGTYKKIVDTYNSGQGTKDGVHVTWDNGPSSTDQLLTNYTTMLRARGHTTDLMSIDVTYPAEFASNGWAAQLDSYWPVSDRSNYLPGPIQSCTYQGHVVAVPIRTDVGLIYYRTDIISTPPTTWEELTSMAKANASKSKYGYVWQGDQYEGLVCDFVEVIEGYGGHILDPSNSKSVTVNSPEGLAALTEMVSWVGTISPTAVTTYEEPQALTVWQNANAIFMRNWPYAVALSNTPSQSKIVNKFDIHPLLPGGTGTSGHSCIGGWNAAINAYSPNASAVWKFVQYLIGPDAQKELAIGASFTPALASTYDDSAVLQAQPLFAKLKPALQSGVSRPVSPRYPDVTHAVQQYIHAALLKQLTPSAALSQLASSLQTLVS